jgi:hypothetical protein
VLCAGMKMVVLRNSTRAACMSSIVCSHSKDVGGAVVSSDDRAQSARPPTAEQGTLEAKQSHILNATHE